jgi:hypothetical protein
MERDYVPSDYSNTTKATGLGRDFHADLAALAIKEPFLRPICRHLSELIAMGRGDSHSAVRLTEYIIASRPAEEADFWRGLHPVGR